MIARYSRPEMARIWSDDSRFSAWLRVELAATEVLMERGVVPREAQEAIKAKARFEVARIEEIAPTADPESRTVLLKARLDPKEGLRAGMFGRLLQPCGRKTALLIPASALRRSGQLEMVRVLEDGAAQIRQVRTGKLYGARIEVLSGLREGDLVLSGGK